MMMKTLKCDVCGKFVGYADIGKGLATHRFVLPDSEFTTETFETLCRDHRENKSNEARTL